MNIKSRIAKLERYCSIGHEVIVPSVEFVGGSNQEDCTHAVAFWGDRDSHRVERGKAEGFSDFRRRFVEIYKLEIQNWLCGVGLRAIVLEYDAELL